MTPFNVEGGSSGPWGEPSSREEAERAIDRVGELDPELADDLVRATKVDGECREQLGPELWEMFKVVRDEGFIHAGSEFEQGYMRILNAMDPSEPERYHRLRKDIAAIVREVYKTLLREIALDNRISDRFRERKDLLRLALESVSDALVPYLEVVADRVRKL